MLPKRYQVQSNTQDTQDTFTLVLTPLEEKCLSFLPGQFNMLYFYGFGEVPISISGDPSNKTELIHTIRAVGPLTQAMQKLKKGDEIGVRGPFGTSWPVSQKGGNVLVVSGGLGMAPLKPAMTYLAANRNQYENVTLLYGTRTPKDLLYTDELKKWEKQGITVAITVDKTDETWQGNVGVVTGLIHKHLRAPQNTRVLVCGPEIMMKFTVTELLRSDVPEQEIYLSMERNMKCANGVCGHCQYGPYFLCKDGPIFTLSQLKPWLLIKEL